MFAVDCPYCQHANRPGARFCADCGAPLHLKPCPTCGKVDDVTARQCGGCGTVFPSIRMASAGGEMEPEAPQESASPSPLSVAAAPGPVVAPPTSGYRPGPLIAVALVAGGLPMLWMNRDLLPQPRAWQAEPPKASSMSVPSSATLAEPVVLRPATTVPPAPAAAVEPASPPEPVAAPQHAESTTKPAPKPKRPRDAASGEKSERNQDRPASVSEAPRPPAPVTRQCTESLVAMGLCDRAQLGN